MGIRGFVEDRGGKCTILQGNRNVQKIDGGRRKFIGEFYSRVKVVCKGDEIEQLRLGKRRNDQTVVDIPAEVFRKGSWKGGVYLFLKKTHEQAGIAGSHFGTHCHATNLVKEFTVERESIQGEHKFSKAKEGGSWRLKSGTTIQEMLKG